MFNNYRQENLYKVPLFDRLFGALADPALRSRSASTASESSEPDKVDTRKINKEMNDTIFKSITTFSEVKKDLTNPSRSVDILRFKF